MDLHVESAGRAASSPFSEIKYEYVKIKIIKNWFIVKLCRAPVLFKRH